MERSIFGFILRYSMRQQGVIVLLTIIGYPVLYATLELPKIIVDRVISVDETVWIDREYFGLSFGQVEFLLTLSFLFLFLIAFYGGMKYFVNVYSGRLGEQMLRRMRYQLYSRALRFPLPHFKRVSQGELLPMITAEVEPLGGFIGIAFSIPALMGGMLVVYMFFIFQQSFFLGLAAIALYPIQAYIIPKMQKRVIELGRQRVREVRRLGDKLGESISGVNEIHAHYTARFERADVTRRLNRIYEIRYEIFRRKFAIKFLNNFLAQLTPFFFYSIGGYYVLQGELTFGALVAVIAAYKDLSNPWKELLNYYQLQADVKVKYEQVVEQFEVPDMLDEKLQDGEVEEPVRFEGELSTANLTYSEDGRVKTVEGVNLSIPLDQHVAIVGGGASGKEDLVLLLSRLLMPSGGSIRIDGQSLVDLPETVLGQHIAYTSAQPYLFATTVRENLYYGLKHRPVRDPEYDEETAREMAKYRHEAEQSGNSPDDPDADWVDYEAAGVEDEEALQERALEVLQMVELDQDVYRFGLRATIDPAEQPQLADGVLQARDALRQKLQESGMADLVEPFDESRYNDNATLGENLLFGTPRDSTFDIDRLADHPYVRQVLDEAGLTDDLLEVGRQVAETMLEIFRDLPPGHEFFEQYSFISSDELPEYQALLSRTARQDPSQMREEDRQRLLSLPFRLIPARHRLDAIDDELRNRILEARRIFREQLPEELQDSVEFFDSAKYNAAASIQDNILFGKIAYGHAQAETKVSAAIGDVLDSLELRPQVMVAGLDHHVGVGGSRVSAAQRQKISLARCILKRPEILILNEAITSLEGSVQMRVRDAVLKEFEGRAVIWALHRVRYAEPFDKVLVMRNGRVVEQGEYDELNREGTEFAELLAAE